jgi:pectate lyase
VQQGHALGAAVAARAAELEGRSRTVSCVPSFSAIWSLFRYSPCDASISWLANAEDWTTTQPFPESELTYSYAAEPVECVKKVVTASAGAKL